jgi:probable HAF family extracellular repeat protein
MIKAITVSLGLLFVCAFATPAASQEYEIIDLGTLGGSTSGAYCISENGTIAGFATTAPGVKHPVLWIDGSIVDLGSPPGFPVGEAVGVNDSGQASVTGEDNPQAYGGFLWEDGNWTDLGVLAGRSECIPEDIDGDGRIVGACLTLGVADAAAFIWESGEMTDIGTLSGTARAYGINELGQIVGFARADQPGGDGQERAFLWEGGSMTELPPLPGRDNSQAFGLNDLGDAAGSSWYPSGPYSLSADRATLWKAGVDPVDLGQTPGPPVCSGDPYYNDNIALAVNNHGEVVGHAECITSGGYLAAFLWRNGTMYNLNDLIPSGSGWNVLEATDINDAGQIVGLGTAPGGGSHVRAFLLVPSTASVADEVDATSGRGVIVNCYPSPFGPRTTISFALEREQHVRVASYDLAGRQVAVLDDHVFGAGSNSVDWDGRDEDGRAMPSGTYFIRVETESRVGTGKVTLVR